MDHLVFCASHHPGRTARRPDRYRSSRESSWSRSGGCCHSATCQHRAMEAGLDRRGLRCPDHGPSDGIELERCLWIGLVRSLGLPCLPRGGGGARRQEPWRIHTHPERLLRGYPSVEGGFTNPSPVPIRLRGCPSLPSCLSLPVAFLWQSWMRESCCSCHPCLCQPWRPL